jgi:hypothetical protein
MVPELQTDPLRAELVGLLLLACMLGGALLVALALR